MFQLVCLSTENVVCICLFAFWDYINRGEHEIPTWCLQVPRILSRCERRLQVHLQTLNLIVLIALNSLEQCVIRNLP